MKFVLLSICLSVLDYTFTEASEPYYVITVPSQMHHPSVETVCATFLYLKDEINIKLELYRDEHSYLLAEDKISLPNYFRCFLFEVPFVKGGEKQVWFFHISAQGENININQTKKVLLVKGKPMTIIQTDKPLYKPGQTVKFRVVTVDKDFYARDDKYPLVELRDPNGNRIGQWLDVSPVQGIADFTFPLAEELTLGEYTITIPNQFVKSFSVSEYVPKRFEVNIFLPSRDALTDDIFTVKACGRYNYGKPVLGSITFSICLQANNPWEVLFEDVEEDDMKAGNSEMCQKISAEQTDSRGCVSKNIDLRLFNFSNSDSEQHLNISCVLTEDSTGHMETASTTISVDNLQQMYFVDVESYYQKGIPFSGMVHVKGREGRPKRNTTVFLEVNVDDIELNMVFLTNDKGIAHFKLDTSEWNDLVSLRAKFSLDEDENIFSEAFMWLYPFYSESNSFLKVEKISYPLSCDTEQPIRVEYVINMKDLGPNFDHLSFFYMILAKGGINGHGEYKLNVAGQWNGSPLQGSFILKIPVAMDLIPEATLMVFTVLPNGDVAADRAKYAIPTCFRNKVGIEFSEKKVRPGRKVNLGIRAEAGSLCSIRSVDKGLLLHQTHEKSTLSSTLVEIMSRMFQMDKNGFLYAIEDFEKYPCLERESQSTSEGLKMEAPWFQSEPDVYNLFKGSGLKIFTNTKIRKPVSCLVSKFTLRMFNKKQSFVEDTDPPVNSSEENPEDFQTRTFFPDTWLYDLVVVGRQGHSLLNVTAPDSITKWVTDAFCLGKSGFGEINDVELTTFKPYFIDLTLPYSVVLGEEFPLTALVFSYLKRCMVVMASLPDSMEYTIVHGTKKQYSCLCADQSSSFTWNVTATKIGTIKVQVRSTTWKQEGGCVGTDFEQKKKYRSDSVGKNIKVKPRGVLEEHTQTFLLCPSDNSIQEEIPLKLPYNLVPGSEYAQITVLGDIMGSAINNVGQSLKLPFGCGEQNMVNFAPNIHIMEYLQSTKQLTPQLRDTALGYLITGYQRQLLFKHDDGSYSAFGKKDIEGNTWLTAFVVRSFSQARELVYIEEKHVQEAVTWLSSQQLPNGCFQSVGTLFNNQLKSGVDDEVTFAAYITIALLESGIVYNSSVVENSLKCLKNATNNVNNTYSQALLAYAFTLTGDSSLRHHMLGLLEKKAIRKDGSKHWAVESSDSGGIEVSSYVLLALLSDKTVSHKDIEESSRIVSWVIKQQNPWGGFASTQDTVVALHALSKYAKATFTENRDVKVKVHSSSGFQKHFVVDKYKSLLLQQEPLPDIPGTYTVAATGRGCVYVQAHLKYHVLLAKSVTYFALIVRTQPTACLLAAQKSFEILVEVSYCGNRISSNMAIVEVELLSGFISSKGSIEKLEKNPLVKKTEVTAEKVTMYLEELKHETEQFSLFVEQETPVKNLQPANVLVYDYYDPGEHAEAEYNSPCRKTQDPVILL
ncbi:alpha-2-macroglobulin-like protein 1 [Spea bombifrons]|uniref:alpha-2-macroglobulin-like protein 1 n=1 Tax=Spea bombifrons TaxID=233779 RepID=UPI0023497653|nr:alpha-2-macroglobulin-like protein 1 [Spea bombifrons]